MRFYSLFIIFLDNMGKKAKIWELLERMGENRGMGAKNGYSLSIPFLKFHYICYIKNYRY